MENKKKIVERSLVVLIILNFVLMIVLLRIPEEIRFALPDVNGGLAVADLLILRRVSDGKDKEVKKVICLLGMMGVLNFGVLIAAVFISGNVIEVIYHLLPGFNILISAVSLGFFRRLRSSRA